MLKYASHEMRGEILEIVLKDIQDDIFVSLTYRVYPRADDPPPQPERGRNLSRQTS